MAQNMTEDDTDARPREHLALCVVIVTLTGQALLLLIVSYFGAVVPIGDSIAVFRLQIAAFVALGALGMMLTGSRRVSLILLAVAVLSGGTIAKGFVPVSIHLPPAPYTLYQKNLLKKERSRALLVEDILTQDPDLLTLQEMTKHDLVAMEQLFDAFDHQFLCTDNSFYSYGFLSRFPLVRGTETCLDRERMAAAQVVLPDGSRLWVVSLHLGWPYPAGQHEQAAKIAAWLKAQGGRIVIGGDFNMVPWGSTVQTIALAAEGKRVGPYFGTFPASGPLLPLPIDHVLIPKAGAGFAEARPPLGSDHLGILARFSATDPEL